MKTYNKIMSQLFVSTRLIIIKISCVTKGENILKESFVTHITYLNVDRKTLTKE